MDDVCAVDFFVQHVNPSNVAVPKISTKIRTKAVPRIFILEAQVPCGISIFPRRALRIVRFPQSRGIADVSWDRAPSSWRAATSLPCRRRSTYRDFPDESR